MSAMVWNSRLSRLPSAHWRSRSLGNVVSPMLRIVKKLGCAVLMGRSIYYYYYLFIKTPTIEENIVFSQLKQ